MVFKYAVNILNLTFNLLTKVVRDFMKKLFSFLVLFPLIVFAGTGPEDSDKGLDKKNIDPSVNPAV